MRKLINFILLPSLIFSTIFMYQTPVKAAGNTYSVIYSFPGPDTGTKPSDNLLISNSIIYGTTTTGGIYNKGIIYSINLDGSNYQKLHDFDGPNGENPTSAMIISGDTLYGNTAWGGTNGRGTIFSIKTDGTNFQRLHSFPGGADGSDPLNSLVLSNNVLYGTGRYGGTNNKGVIFSINPDGTNYQVLRRFVPADGTNPSGDLIISNNVIYGTNSIGGTTNDGTVFSMNTDGTNYHLLHDFNGNNGKRPMGGLVLSGGVLYGTTYENKSGWGYGSIFKVNTDGTGFQTLKTFWDDGRAPYGSLTISGGVLYGVTESAIGAFDDGTVFAINTDGTGFRFIKQFNDANGEMPRGGLVLLNGTLYGATYQGGVSDQGTLFSVKTDGTSFTTTYNFQGWPPQGSSPRTAVIHDNGVLYGTAYTGGANNKGSIYSVNVDGTDFRLLYSFNCVNGCTPYGSLLLSEGILYGTVTSLNGGYGAIYSINPDGTNYQVLHQFNYNNGDSPTGALILVNNLLYGMTTEGGANDSGTIFSINKDGTGFNSRYSFSYDADGGYPYGSLIYENGVLYGVNTYGGSEDSGTVFKINPDGTNFQVLHAFNYSDGNEPYGDLVYVNGVLYGVTTEGGDNYAGTIFSVNTDGTNFRTLRSFDEPNDGSYPYGSLIVSDNVLYGAANGGGSDYSGTIFSINPDGTNFQVLYSLNRLTDGRYPMGNLLKVNETFYGVTSSYGNLIGGIYSYGPSGETPEPTPTPTLSSSPTPTPTATPTHVTGQNNNNTVSGGSASTGIPGCTDPMPWKPPYIYQIDTNDTTATLYFVPAGDPVNKYYVEYMSVKDQPQHGLVYDETHNTSALRLTIYKLGVNTTYYFRIKGGNGCNVGGWSNTMAAKTTKNAKSISKYFPGSLVETTITKIKTILKPSTTISK